MQVYLVGGAVRDQLLNYPVYDKDWVVVGATVDEMLEQGFQPVGKDFPVFIHPKTGEEYALARTERKSGKGYTGFQYFASPDVTLEEDLIRRDLTINAMAQADNGEIIDPYQGQQDLNNHILRHVSPAFAEDPLRVLRVARFYARYAHLGFDVAEETVDLMIQLSTSDELIHLTAERVWKETERALAEETPFAYIELLERCQALPVLFPEWQCLIENEQHVRTVLNRLQRNKRFGQNVFSCLMTSATTQQPDDAALKLIAEICERLRTPKAWLQQAQQVRQWHKAIADIESLSGAQRFEIVQSLDLLRRPQRLDGVFECCAALHELNGTLLERMQQLLTALNQLQAGELIAEGFKGKALGDELNRRRAQICDQI
ncbi:hypothetical protein QKW35_00440 [Pontibacterium granulatum]|uniref:hypothetical protein n=1 Tax=Pontibacterium granulatum TaxID=2036029 RepID=UPI00249BEB14|nr:hypothetical protein [Pontibacterium granulatum]MDI3322832.1 hypothetical protein [Pontibacterium granulatum]